MLSVDDLDIRNISAVMHRNVPHDDVFILPIEKLMTSHKRTLKSTVAIYTLL